MPRLINASTEIKAEGNPPKLIKEFIGRVNTKTDNVSIAQMTSPQGWSEPGQRPEFGEYSIVFKGRLNVRCEDGSTIDVNAGQAVMVDAGEWVQYSTPHAGGAEYISICLPAFSPDTVNRD